MICFIVNVYKEPPDEVAVLIASLRENYPGDKIMVLEDGGDTYPGIEADFIKRFNHKKTSKWGGFWTHRYLDQGLRRFPEADYYIKIDPDTSVKKRAEQLPDGEAIFCAVYAHKLAKGDVWYVPHGGALGFTHQAAKRIVSERLMLNRTFVGSGAYWAHNDLMLADVIKWSGLTLVSRPDFDCGKTRQIGPDTTFAHTH